MAKSSINVWQYAKWVIPTAIIGTGIYLTSRVIQIQTTSNQLLNVVIDNATKLAEKLQASYAVLQTKKSIIMSACKAPQKSEQAQTYCKNLIDVADDAIGFVDTLKKATLAYLDQPKNLELLDALVKTIEISFSTKAVNTDEAAINTNQVMDVWKERYEKQIQLLRYENATSPTGIVPMLDSNNVANWQPFYVAMFASVSNEIIATLSSALVALAKSGSSSKLCFGV